MKKRYFEPNPLQLELRQEIIENTKRFVSQVANEEITISHESVYEYNGSLTFILNKQTTKRNTLLILFDSAWLVNIGRRGRVTSRQIQPTGNEERKMKPNKNLLFI